MTKRIKTEAGVQAAVNFMEAYFDLIDHYNDSPNRTERHKVLEELREAFINMAEYRKNNAALAERMRRADEN